MKHLYGCGSNGEEIAFDRKTADNPNLLVIGATGAGKHHIVKNEIISNLLHGDSEDKIIIVDVYGEYRNFAKEHGGEIVDFHNTFINPCDMSFYDGDTADKADSLISFIETVTEKECNAVQKNYIGEVCSSMYNFYKFALKTIDNAFIKRDKCPALSKFYDKLRFYGKETEKIITAIEPYCNGLFSNLFSHDTNINTDNRLTVIDVSSISERHIPIALQVSLMYIWSVMTENRSKSAYTWVYLEELQRYFRNNALARSLADIFKRAGTQNGIITGITQNITNNSEQTSRIFHCCTGNLILLSQNEAVAEQMKYLYNIPDNLIEYIKNVPVCNGLIRFDRGDFIPFVQFLERK